MSPEERAARVLRGWITEAVQDRQTSPDDMAKWVADAIRDAVAEERARCKAIADRLGKHKEECAERYQSVHLADTASACYRIGKEIEGEE